MSHPVTESTTQRAHHAIITASRSPQQPALDVVERDTSGVNITTEEISEN